MKNDALQQCVEAGPLSIDADPSGQRRKIDPAEILPAEWVFGYGSLIWNPEFDFQERRLARVRGYHRTFCISSTRYRGTPQRPGVVLGLARGGSVSGMAFRLHDESRVQALVRLYEREMTDRVYAPRLLHARLDDGRAVRALGFVADPNSPAYLELHEDEVTRRLCGCAGSRGPNCEYAINTFHALESLGVHDARLARLVRRIEAQAGRDFVATHRRIEP